MAGVVSEAYRRSRDETLCRLSGRLLSVRVRREIEAELKGKTISISQNIDLRTPMRDDKLERTSKGGVGIVTTLIIVIIFL
jgi:hypothetical protein